MGNNYTIQRLLQKSFTEHYDRNAILYAGKTYSYNQLDERAEYYASVINERVPDGKTIAVMMQDPYETICAILAVIKMGKSFLPVNVEYPVSTITQMFSVRPDIVLTDPIGKEMMRSIKSTVLFVDCSEVSVFIKEKVGFNTSCEEQSCLYIYFTSGTTGKPKGILGKNISLYHFILWEIKQFQMKKDYIFSQFTPFCHDPFLRDVFTPLALGACIAIPDSKEELIDGRRLKEFIRNSHVSAIHCTPSLFRILVQSGTHNRSDFPDLRYILLAGERLDSLLLKPWYDVFGDQIQLVNLYGPTETTLAKLFYCVSPEDTRLNSIPIGKPISGAQVLLLDSQMKLCTHGQVGEIYIRTPYMSLGYFEDEALTMSRFIESPFSSENDPLDYIFKTGDKGRILPNGNIEYIGRIDRQVKIHGFRVELDAIETVLGSYPAITSCAVKHFETLESLFIVGYITARTDLSHNELSSYMKDQLPDYMCPAGFVQMEQLPVTHNNKINYQALQFPDHFSDSDYSPPTTETERKLEKTWCDLLRRKRFSIVDDFMLNGGNSLNTMFMINQTKETFGFELSIGRVFSGVTIQQLAQEIDRYQEQQGSTELIDVENRIIELTKMDARYIRVFTQKSSWNVLFLESEHIDLILQTIVMEFKPPVHPNYICKMNNRASILPDEIDYFDEEFKGFLTLIEDNNIEKMKVECNRLLLENNEIEDAITSSSAAVKRSLPLVQIVRSYIPEINGAIFNLAGIINQNALDKAFRSVLQNESLMRCILKNDTEWLEYQTVPEVHVPILDLTDYSKHAQEEIIQNVIIPQFYQVRYPKHNALQWRVAMLRLNHAENVFILSANHLIFDGFSKRVFEDEILLEYKRFLHGEQDEKEKKYTYFTYMDELKKTSLLAKNNNWLVSTDDFTSLCKKLKRNTNNEKSQLQKITLQMEPILCRYPEMARDEIMARTAYYVFIHTLCAHFDTTRIPFVTISDGRKMGSLCCYDCIGEFIDYIPFIGTYDTDLNFEKYNEYLSRVEKEGINILESFGGITRDIKLAQFLRNILIVYNYQHYAMNSGTGNKEILEPVKPEVGKVINFIVRPDYKTMEIIISGPIRMESLQNIAETVCSTVSF